MRQPSGGGSKEVDGGLMVCQIPRLQTTIARQARWGGFTTTTIGKMADVDWMAGVGGHVDGNGTVTPNLSRRRPRTMRMRLQLKPTRTVSTMTGRRPRKHHHRSHPERDPRREVQRQKRAMRSRICHRHCQTTRLQTRHQKWNGPSCTMMIRPARPLQSSHASAFPRQACVEGQQEVACPSSNKPMTSRAIAPVDHAALARLVVIAASTAAVQMTTRASAVCPLRCSSRSWATIASLDPGVWAMTCRWGWSSPCRDHCSGE